MPSSLQIGRAAEALAANHLIERGATLLHRNYRYGRTEVDLIAQQAQILLFVEVKARKNDHFGWPETFVTDAQQSRIQAAAEHYLLTHRWPHAIRFDIIAVCLAVRGMPQITYFEDAF